MRESEIIVRELEITMREYRSILSQRCSRSQRKHIVIHYNWVTRSTNQPKGKMADSHRSTSDVVHQLLEQVQELSDRISPNPDVNSEVSRVFGRRASHTSAVATSTTTNNAQSSSTGSALRRPGTFFAARRNLAARRPTTRRSSLRSRTNSGPFLRDLVLLSGPDVAIVPRQGARVRLMEHGHIISACQFDKAMNQTQVEATIREAFDEKIPPLVDLEVVMSVHNSLIKPSLAPGQAGIDGVILHRLFKAKPVYVKPSRELLLDPYQVSIDGHSPGWYSCYSVGWVGSRVKVRYFTYSISCPNRVRFR